MSRKEILHSTLVDLRAYDEGYKLRRELEDEMLYLSGIYTYEAVATALANGFREKGKKAIDYRNEPILQSIKPLTEEEIMRRRKAFVERLETIGRNINLAKGLKDGTT